MLRVLLLVLMLLASLDMFPLYETPSLAIDQGFSVVHSFKMHLFGVGDPINMVFEEALELS